jgi:voltage-gated potassium channel
MPMKSWRRKVHDLLEPGEQASPWEQVFDVLVLLVILVSVSVVVLQSMPELAVYDPLFSKIEAFAVYFFTAEYVARLWTAPEIEKYGGGWRGRLRYAFSLMALVDLAAILPFYLAAFADSNTVVFRLLRVFRLVRVLKFGRYHSSIGILGRVLLSRREELVVSVGLVLALVVITSTLMYAVEHDAQPKVFSSIPASMWWGVVTLTTVGYGDVYPITLGGRLFTSVVLLLGLGFVAVPTGLLAGALSRAREQEKKLEEEEEALAASKAAAEATEEK